MANPYFSNSSHFGRSKPQPGSVSQVGYQPNAQAYGAPDPYGQPAYGTQTYATPAPGPTDQQFQDVQSSYYGPDAGSAQTGRLTIHDVIMKTGGVLGLLVAVAALTWVAVPDALLMPVLIVGLIGGLVLGLVNSFKKEPSPVLILAYAVFQGALLGGISKIFEYMYEGIVVQAVLATFITFGVTLALFSSGKVRVTPKFTKFLMIGLISYGIFSLVNLGLMLFTNVGGAFGMRSIEILGLPIGVVIGAFAVILAAMTLIMDFDQIQRGVANGVARKFAWAAAFGITVSLVWLYLEFLRILALLRGN